MGEVMRKATWIQNHADGIKMYNVSRALSPKGIFFIFINFFFNAPHGRNRVDGLLLLCI
jgi:hypothetical protein